MTARVLVGDFGAIGSVGLGAMLDAEGLAFETARPTAGELLARVAEGETDVVVLDRKMRHALGAAATIAAEHSHVRVIVCSLDDTMMSVFPEQGGPAYEAPLDPPRLASAIRKPS